MVELLNCPFRETVRDHGDLIGRRTSPTRGILDTDARKGAGVTRRPTADAPATTDESRGPAGIRAVERTARVLLALARHPRGIGLSEFSRELQIPVGTLHRTVAALKEQDLVRETHDARIALSVGVLVLSNAYLAGVDLREESLPVLLQLGRQTGETVHLGVLSSPSIVYIEKIDSAASVRMVSRVGGTNPAVHTAIGHAILAYSSPETVEKVVADSSLQLSDEGAARRFRDQLDRVREIGYAVDLEENEVGICCVGAPVFDNTGAPTAAISVSTPAHRFRHEEETALGTMVREMADTVSRRLGARLDEIATTPAR